MITEVDDYFAKGCGRCARFDTADCSTKRWLPGLLALRRRIAGFRGKILAGKGATER